jgi:hypothetical protein
MPATRPHPSRLAPHDAHYDDIIAAHELAIENGDGSYRDPATGLIVLTVETHLSRGFCCNSGCRHCPYVDEI